MSNFENIERCCQLHERLVILYVVDGYEAAIYTGDREERKVMETKNDDILGALLMLDKQCANLTWQDIRKMRTIN